LRLVAGLVEDLYLVDHLGGQVLQGDVGVITEELLAVHQYALHRFALCLDGAVVVDDAGHLGHQVLGRGVGMHLEGVGVEDGGVTFLLHALHHGGGFHFLQGDHRTLQIEHEPGGASRYVNVALRRYIPGVRSAQDVLALGHVVDTEQTVRISNSATALSGVIRQQEEYAGAGQGTLVLLIAYPAIHGALSPRTQDRQLEEEQERGPKSVHTGSGVPDRVGRGRHPPNVGIARAHPFERTIVHQRSRSDEAAARPLGIFVP